MQDFQIVSSREPERGTLEWLTQRYREDLECRVASGDYSPRRLPVTLSYVHSFLDYVYKERGAAGVRLGSLLPEQARQLHLTSWLISHYWTWTTGSTRADALGAVLTCFSWLEEHGFGTSPFRRPKNLKFPRAHHRAMRLEHYRAVMRAAKGDVSFRAMLLMMWYTGVRPIEFRQLEPQEIDWQARVCRIPKNKRKTGKKQRDDRPVGLNRHLLPILRRLVEAMAPGQKYVFATLRGRPWTKDTLGRYYSRYRRAAGVPAAIKLCGSRHGFAVRLLSDGVTSSKAVADQLGHSSSRMVESIYGAETRYDAEMVREVADRAQRRRRKPRPEPEKPPTRGDDSPLFDGLA